MELIFMLLLSNIYIYKQQHIIFILYNNNISFIN